MAVGLSAPVHFKMEASMVPIQSPPPAKFEPDVEKIKRKLLRQGVYPTPKIIRTLRKREIQKHNRKTKQSENLHPPLSPSKLQTLADESHFRTLKHEYRRFSRAIDQGKTQESTSSSSMVGKPWERIERVQVRELASGNKEFHVDGLKRESLEELRQMFQEDLSWVLEDDVEIEDDGCVGSDDGSSVKRWRNEKEAIQVLVKRLSDREITAGHWKFVRILKQSGLQFTEWQLLRIVEGLGQRGSCRQGIDVVEWVYKCKELGKFKSRFVYTKLLSVLGKARKYQEAQHIFNQMLGDFHIYPDIATYHCIAVTLGQAGLLKDLLKVMEKMREKPKKLKKQRKNWDPALEPDIVVYNAVLNACVPLHEWKGVSWVFEQLRKSGLKPNGATYGLAMEVMLQSGKYDAVHELFRKLKKSGEAVKPLTYRVLVKAFSEEGKINEAVQAVRDMEERGIVGTGCVYYELACCLCKNGKWQEAIAEVDTMRTLSYKKPMEVTFTGLILASMDGGHVHDCISTFEYMKMSCSPNIGAINAMLKVYGRNDMFFKAKELFEEIRKSDSDSSLVPDGYTYSMMLEASASAHQWEYFEYLYREMVLSGFKLDQERHGLLLLKACRAGKCFILEHAFDALLEAGEIPHLSFFTELLIEAAARSNYERVVTLINAMVHGPFQVSEEQWTDIFEKNTDRVSRDGLEKLVGVLLNCQLSSEVTAANFLRALQSVCRSATSKNTSIITTLRVNPSESQEHSSESNANRKVNTAGFPLVTLDENVEGAAKFMDARQSVSVDDEADKGFISESSTHHIDEAYESEVKTNHESSDDVAAFGENFRQIDGELSSGLEHVDCDTELDMPLDNVTGSSTSGLPSANEILEAWKQSRIKDGILLPSKLGQK